MTTTTDCTKCGCTLHMAADGLWVGPDESGLCTEPFTYHRPRTVTG